MSTCPACAGETREGAKFCPWCGAAQHPPTPGPPNGATSEAATTVLPPEQTPAEVPEVAALGKVRCIDCGFLASYVGGQWEEFPRNPTSPRWNDPAMTQCYRFEQSKVDLPKERSKLLQERPLPKGTAEPWPGVALIKDRTCSEFYLHVQGLTPPQHYTKREAEQLAAKQQATNARTLAVGVAALFVGLAVFVVACLTLAATLGWRP
jgi:hypothetical protein